MTHETSSLPPRALAAVIDHTYLTTEREGATQADQERAVDRLVEEAVGCGAFAVCVRETMVSRARRALERLASNVEIASVIGFPDGDAFTTKEKVELLERAKGDGATEFDMVVRIQDLRAGKDQAVRDDLRAVAEAAGDLVVKIIFEMTLLTPDEKERALAIALEALAPFHGAIQSAGKRHFFKTSTGFAPTGKGGSNGATLEDVSLLAKAAQGRFGIKPAGGVTGYARAVELWQVAGSPLQADGVTIDPYAFRIGSSSLLTKLI